MTVLRFGNFELDIAGRRLSAGGYVLHLGGKAFDILATLTSRAGEIVGKQELIDSVWPNTVVEEGALRVHIVSLRKLLGEVGGGRYIQNVPGRGYVFVAPVDGEEQADAVIGRPGSRFEVATNIPRVPHRLFGRDEFVADTAQALDNGRLVTISGTGGIGKTSVALAVAGVLGRKIRVLFIDLASLNDGRQIMPTLATLLGITTYSPDIDASVLHALGDQELLLLFDNCEHLVDSVAATVEKILAATVDISILATSREPLRIAAEKIRHLPSLAIPPENGLPDEVPSFPAAQLFIERVTQSSDLENLDQPESLATIASIVRQLDGIPLAIELAASRAASLGLSHLAASLDNPLAVLRKGRRTAPPRQQTLRATLDWGYSSLTANEKILLQDISVFAGPFTASAAYAVSSSAAGQDQFYEDFDGLFLKSFLSVIGGDGTYRLLETTKRYAFEKLMQAGRSTPQRTAHALYCQRELSDAERDWRALTTPEWMRRYSALVNDIRTAVRWSMGEPGQAQYAITLVARSHVLWVQLGLMSEQTQLIEWALAAMPASTLQGGDIEMRLRIARGGALYHMSAFVDDEAASHEFVLAADIAKSLAQVPEYIQAVTGATSIWTSNGHYTRSIDAALRIRAEYGELPSHTFSQMLDNAYFFRGDFTEAVVEAEGSIESAKGFIRRTQNTGVGYEQRMIASTILAFVEFLRGRISDAFARLDKLLAEAADLDYAISTLLLLMSGAFPMAFLAGDKARAAAHLEMATGLVRKHALHRWNQWLRGYRLITVDDTDGELADELSGAMGARLDYLVTLAGSRASSEAIERSLAGEVGWSRPEILRLKAERLARSDPRQATEILLSSLSLSKKMQSSFWELRSALTAFKLDPDTFQHDLANALGKIDANPQTTDAGQARKLLGLEAG